VNFDNFKLHPTLATNVRDLGYETPTPIQAQTIPIALQARDLIGLAQTGTGKTAAFALPILQRLLTVPAKAARHPRVLVLAPTRELCEQINDSFNALGRGTGLRGTTIYGGVGLKPQLKALRTGVDIVVACPGRLLDHIKERTIDLSHIEVLVLDEADHMFDMGFLPSIRKILAAVPEKRQTLLFSATMPADIHALAAEALTDPQTVQIDRVRPTETVSHAVYPVVPHLKVDLLLELLKRTDTESVLVFVAAKHRATRVAEKLEKAGYRATSLQGNLSQGRRQEALNGFRDGTYQVMVATDVAARGIDIASVSHVINFDMPSTLDSYTHRIGRTGRAARTGDAYTFVTSEDYGMVQSIERALGAKLERCYIDGFDYKAPAPAKDATFARPPRERRQPGAAAPKLNKPKAPKPPTAAVAAKPAPASGSARPRRRRFRGLAGR
jgi:ATP-dependent RNA helicase RhlE